MRGRDTVDGEWRPTLWLIACRDSYALSFAERLDVCAQKGIIMHALFDRMRLSSLRREARTRTTTNP